MKLNYLPMGLILAAGLAGPVHAGTWEGAQYFNRGFRCSIVPQPKKKSSDDAKGYGSALKKGRLEAFGKKMRMEMESEAMPVPSSVKSKSGSRAGRPGSHAGPPTNMIMIVDYEAHRSFWLVPEKKMYIESDISKERDKDRGEDMFNRHAELEELGRETIEGHPCRKVRPSWVDAKGKKEKSSEILWLASDLHDFPVQSMNETSGDVVHYRDIQFGPVPNSRFEVPAGYAKGSMQDLVGSSMSPQDKAKMDQAMKQMKEKMNTKEGREAMEKMKEALKKQEGGK